MFSLQTSGILNEPENYGGKIIGVATECITIGKFCDVTFCDGKFCDGKFSGNQKKPVVSVLGSN
jgi:hypothetical protein